MSPSPTNFPWACFEFELFTNENKILRSRVSFELFCKLGPSSLLAFGFINCETIIWPGPSSPSPGSFHLSGIIFLKISTGLKWSFLPDRNVLFSSKCQISSNTSNFENNKQSSTRPGSLFLKLENQRPFLSHGWNKDLNCFNLSWLLVHITILDSFASR